MALPKRVKVGGSYYKGYSLTVNASAADYTLDMTLTEASAINGINIIPDAYGAGDYFTIQHLDSASAIVETLVDTVYNVGASAAWHFDLSALELMGASHKFRLIYTSVAGVAMTVYTCVEHIK